MELHLGPWCRHDQIEYTLSLATAVSHLDVGGLKTHNIIMLEFSEACSPVDRNLHCKSSPLLLESHWHSFCCLESGPSKHSSYSSGNTIHHIASATLRGLNHQLQEIFPNAHIVLAKSKVASFWYFIMTP